MFTHRFSTSVNRIFGRAPERRPAAPAAAFVAVPALLLGSAQAASQHQELYRAAYQAALRQVRARMLRRFRPSMN